MNFPEFVAWPKTPRLFRDVIVTEKIDGTNAAVVITPGDVRYQPYGVFAGHFIDRQFYYVSAQSRKRLITPEDDNMGFAAWVAANSLQLVQTLGEGHHYGEWWGSGIQRGYGLAKGTKVFSLFNVKRWEDADLSYVPNLDVVPVLYRGPFAESAVRDAVAQLQLEGSVAAPGFTNPEGVVVFHTASGQVYKVLIENDELPKGLVNA